MRGYRIVYLNTDFMRDTTFDSEIGTTIAQRHNGSFELIMMPDEDKTIDYFYSIMYMSSGDYIALPEVTELCFMVPRSGLKSLFWVLIDPYDAFAWIAFGTSVFLVSLVLTCFGESLRHYGLGLVVLEILMSTVNGPTHKFVGPFESRIVGLFLLLCIVLISGYQSLVISFMSAPRYDPELDTMQQINDSCFFQYDVFLSSLGYNFKNIRVGFVEDNSVENSWRRKKCDLLPCSETKVINVNSVGEPTELLQGLGLFSAEELELLKLNMKYFRYSKARLQSQVSLYQVSFDSPAHHLVERYTRAFIEGQLHYFPVLQKTKHSTGEYSPKDKLVETTGPGDLLIIWVIYVAGILASGVSFLCELGVLCVRKMKRVQWRRCWSSFKHLCNRRRSKKSTVVECY
ncbi:uncharacterized protein LOC131293133 [Anopheles ziemanni]|uniref:uncharacterized protein LOC131264050 n=1 Tax=Anopheles coustani TaxID=139045 RepID=UPI0026592056|nr:uncharacterized protein LOC131264050 [Anopheles coustani]XP_058177194.1 uncharacterized protein LOC131293133 [Anopheles ziemanni]